MKLNPRKPTTPFDFVAAVTALFQTDGGKAFAWRLLFWTTAGLSIIMIIALPMILPHYGDLLDTNYYTMQAILNNETPSAENSAAVLEPFKKVMLPGLFLTLGFWAAYAAGEAALHRKVINGQEFPKRPLRFGKDELRVMLAQLGIWGVWFLVYIVGVTIIVIFASLGGVGVVLAIPAVIIMIVAMVYIPVRLAPAAALSVANKRAHLFAAMRITKGRFWPLFGAYCVVFLGGYFLLYAVLLTVIFIVTGDSQAMVSISGMGNTMPSEVMAQAAERLKNPIFMAIGILGIIAYSLAYALWLLSVAGVGAYAVKWWQADDPIAPFD